MPLGFKREKWETYSVADWRNFLFEEANLDIKNWCKKSRGSDNISKHMAFYPSSLIDIARDNEDSEYFDGRLFCDAWKLLDDAWNSWSRVVANYFNVSIIWEYCIYFSGGVVSR